MKTIEIRTLIGENCITQEDGQKVYDLVHPEIQVGHAVQLDFSGIGVFASPFFNAALGQLLKDTKPEALNRLLKLEHLTDIGKIVLKRVIENAKQYYSDDVARKAIDDILTEQSEER